MKVEAFNLESLNFFHLPSMRDGTCLAETCIGLYHPQTIEHILLN